MTQIFKSLTNTKAFLILYFLIQLTHHTCSISSIVGMSLSEDDPLVKTAIIVAIQAIAAILALVISKFILPKNIFQNIILKLVVLGAFGSILVFSLPISTPTWYLSVFFRQTIGILLIAKLISNLREYCQDDIINTNKQAQTVGAFAWVSALGIGPVIVSLLSLQKTFLVDAVILLGSTTFIFYLESLKNKEQATTQTEESTDFQNVTQITSPKIKLILFITFAIWCVAGIFHVLEVPILKERFNVTPTVLSVLFILTAISNLLIIHYFKATWLKKKVSLFFFLTALSLIWASVAYIYTYSLVLVFFIVLILGAANGLFNLSQSTLLQQIEEEKERTNAFILSRLAANMGLLISTTFVAFGHVYGNLALVVSLAAIFFTAVIFMLSNKVNLTNIAVKATVSIFLLTTFLNVDLKADSIRVPVLKIPTEINPATILDSSSGLINGQIFDTLYEYTPQNTLKPVLAHNHSISPDGKIIKITIDTAKKFSNGQFLSASLVIASLTDTIMTMGQTASWAFSDVEGFSDFINKKVPTITGFRALNEEQMIIKLINPFPIFLQVLTSPYFADSPHKMIALRYFGFQLYNQ